ncbi:MAG: DUF4157 domain-containing protein [Crocosphaera sp.]|nr:DUF4157 domain-containing protein [Crocosphaera sp.]
MKHKKLHQQANKSQSDIHPSKGWLQKRERQKTSEHEEDPTVVARSGLKFNFLDVPVQKEQNETIQRSSLNPQTWPYSVLQKQENANTQGLDQGSVPNRTGLPDRLKAGVEHLSGYSLDDVIVHYNSPKPLQLQALAYTQGTDIHVAPRQEKYLPHETWHVVQQMQGRVKPTMQMKGVQINDDAGLEREADVMGNLASDLIDDRLEAITQRKQQEMANNSSQVKQLVALQEMGNNTTQIKRTIQLGRRGAAILKNNSMNDYFSSDFVALHIADDEAEARKIAEHRADQGIAQCHVIKRSSIASLMNEVKERSQNGYYANNANRITGPQSPNQFRSEVLVEIFETKYNKRGALKKQH